MGFFSKIAEGLKKTRNAIAKIFGRGIDEDFFQELEDALICSDMGVGIATEIVEELREYVLDNRIRDEEKTKQALRKIMLDKLPQRKQEFQFPLCIVVVGVNGVGKTTTIGKLANRFLAQKKSVMLAAADTFRAAASEQLAIWAERANVKIVKHKEGADPSAVVFDAIESAKARKTDVLIVDTAGRLHNKAHLMEELKKIDRIIEKNYEGANLCKLLVLDANTGQNGVVQAKAFGETIDIDGIVLTKLDGTSKGGVVFAINNEADLPIYFVGVGEKIDDLQEFDAEEFVQGII